MATHRYWQLVFNATTSVAQGGFSFAVAEIEMAATASGADQCGSGSASSATGAQSGFPVSSAFDDSVTTGWWIVGNSEIAVVYDFGTPVTVREVRIVLFSSAAGGAVRKGSESGPTAVRVRGSDDNAVWKAYGAKATDTERADGVTMAVAVSASAVMPFAVLEGAPLTPSWAPGPVGSRTADAPVRSDPFFGGSYRIASDVAISGTPDVPVSRRVRLFDVETGRLVRETWSDASTGAYEFKGLTLRSYIAVSDDHTHVYNAAVADNLTPVP